MSDLAHTASAAMARRIAGLTLLAYIVGFAFGVLLGLEVAS